MRKHIGIALLLLVCLTGSAVSWADDEPTVQMIYAQAHAGNYLGAQKLLDTVLANHPRSGKAHFLAAELAAHRGDRNTAQQELNLAEQYSPGLPFANPKAVNSLKSQVQSASRSVAPAAEHPSAFPSVAFFLLITVVLILWLVFRRRSVNTMTSASSRFSPRGVAAGGGMGTGIAGGLASGLAMGAGVVAGEELAHHFLDGGSQPQGPAATPQYSSDPAQNSDMGGTDFGVSDNSGWDDSSGGGAGGSDDWS